MNFFPRRRRAETAPEPALAEADNIILNAGRITDQTILESLASSAAFWAVYRRHQTGRLEREYPGYREELNRQRTLAGLPPI